MSYTPNFPHHITFISLALVHLESGIEKDFLLLSLQCLDNRLIFCCKYIYISKLYRYTFV